MNAIFLAATASLILLNVIGLGLLATRLGVARPLARPASVVGLCLGLFFVEHFRGLGGLAWAWPLTTLASAAAYWQAREVLAQDWRRELLFIAAFLYAFAWRFMFPNIDPQSEHMTDLYFIVNYMSGERLPPVDHWLPAYRFNMYYAFQHYSAALLGRIFGVDGGTAYNFAFCLLVGLIIATAWEVITHFCRGKAAALVLFAFVMGGTGVSPLVHHLIEETPTRSADADTPQPGAWETLGRSLGAPLGPKLTLWSSGRFIGSADADINTPLGRSLLPSAKPQGAPADFAPLELPLETFSYLIFLGDFHPPLGGFLLLAMALLCIALLENEPNSRFSQAALAATVPVTLATNAWVFPLQAALLAGWIGYRWWRRMSPTWMALVAGAVAGLLLVYPFLTHFAAAGLSPAMALVRPFDHTPWRHFLALHWPLLALLALALMQRRPLATMLCLVWGGLFLASEFIYVDDLYGGQYERFNTVLKWWAWIYVGAVVTLGAINLGGGSRAAKVGTVIIFLLIGVYALDLARFWVFSPKPHAGRFQGHAWFTDDPTNKAMLAFLRAAEPGIVLERNERGAYTRASAFAIFAGKPALLGWSDHEFTWRGAPHHVPLLAEDVTQFYLGNRAESAQWLLQNKVRYIVWGADENGRAPFAFELINSWIQSHYFWQEFYRAGDYRVGLWIRKPIN